LSKKVEKSSGTESIAQPGPSVRPFLSGLVHREAQGGGGLLVAQTGEVPQLDDLGGYGVVSTEARQRVIEGEEILVGRGRRLVRQLDASPSATMSDALLAARVLDKDAPHRLSRRGEEVAATVPTLGLLGIDEPNVRFMDQCRCLERLPRLFPGQLVRRQLAQLIIDQRQQPLGGVCVALLDGGQDSGDIAHGQPVGAALPGCIG